MNRIVKDAEVRRNEILDTAQNLFYSKGYEQTSVQDIIDAVGIAKGTFYHYFRSKQHMLDAMIDRILLQTIQTLERVVNDDHLNAVEKFNRFFTDGATVKFENQEVIKAFMKVYYHDDNAILRERTNVESLRQVSPLMVQIIQQGVDEGRFVTSYPNSSAEIVMQISQHMSGTVTNLFLAADGNTAVIEIIENKIAAYEEAITRVLGASPGSIRIGEFENYRRWFET